MYNRSLVNRVEDLMDPSFLMNWNVLLEEINRGKHGHPFRAPNAFITFFAKLRALYGVPFRSLEGIARVFSRISGIRSGCYTSIFRRIRKRRGWSKLHAVISIHDVSVLSFAITDDHVHDAMAGRKILESIRDRIAKIFGDQGNDSKAKFNDFGSANIIPPKKNASSQSRGSPARPRVVRLIRRTSEKEWKESVRYGKRWDIAIYFSGLKRTMGEVIKAVRHDYIAQEIALKVQYYNITREMTHAY